LDAIAASIGGCPLDPLDFDACVVGDIFELAEPLLGTGLTTVRFLGAAWSFAPSAFALPEAVRAIKAKEEANMLGLLWGKGSAEGQRKYLHCFRIISGTIACFLLRNAKRKSVF